MMQAPESEHHSSILRVRYKSWAGDWIVQDIHQKQNDPKAWMETTVAEADLVIMFIHGEWMILSIDEIFTNITTWMSKEVDFILVSQQCTFDLLDP